MRMVRSSTSMFATAVLAVLVASSASRAQAEVFSQIIEDVNGVFVANPITQTEMGSTFEAIGIDSQFDTGAVGSADFRPNSATAYDSFSFASDLSITGFNWVGFYEDANDIFADSFTIRVFDNNGSGPAFDNGTGNPALQPGNQLLELTVSGNETENVAGDGQFGFFEYEATLATPFSIDANTTYWFSAVANLDFVTGNAWNFAFSTEGDGTSVQDFGEFLDTPLERFSVNSDLAFSVTAIPEPGSLMALGLTGGLLAFRRRRSSVTRS